MSMSIDPLKVCLLLFVIGTVFYDIKHKKVPNRLNLFGFFIILALSLFNEPTLVHLLQILSSFSLALFLGYGLWRFKVMGAGDSKVIMVISLTLVWTEVLDFVFYSLVWGGLLGLFNLLLDTHFLRQLRIFSFHPVLTMKYSKIKGHKIPLTVGILLGLLTFWTLRSVGVSFYGGG